MTPQDRVKRYQLVAKGEKKFVPAQQKVKRLQDGLKKSQMHLQKLNKSMSKINSSKTANPKIKGLRINKLRALQKYLQASIMLSQFRIKNLQHPM